MNIPYTICFCFRNDQILMLYRYKKPNAYLWNGLGGKIETGETPDVCVRREIMEEAGLSLSDAENLYFAGVVTWIKRDTGLTEGMYAYIANFPDDSVLQVRGETDEGLLAWKDTRWVCDVKNAEVVPNIPRYLPHMLANTAPYLYECLYKNGKLLRVSLSSLPKRIIR